MTFAPSNLTQVPDPGGLRYGLFAIARTITMDSRVRVSGATYDSDGCGTPRGYPADCVGSPGTKTFDANQAEQPILPFVVYASLVCGTAGYTSEYLEAKARRKLEAVEQSGVEQALWAGAINAVTLGNTPTFQNGGSPTGGNPTILTAATTPKAGIAALEDYAALNYGYTPVIHATAGVSAHLAASNLICWEDGIAYTMRGTPVSLGAYPGTSNAGAAPAAGHAWLFITGQITLWKDPSVFVAPAKETLNRTTNQYNLIAERTWAASYDCLIAGIDVTL